MSACAGARWPLVSITIADTHATWKYRAGDIADIGAQRTARSSSNNETKPTMPMPTIIARSCSDGVIHTDGMNKASTAKTPIAV
jgi:hypothetical protein